MQLTFRKKLLLTFFIYGLVLVASTAFIAFSYSKNSIENIIMDNAKSQFAKDKNLLKFYLDNVKAKLDAIKKYYIFQKHLDRSGYTDTTVEDLFLSIARSDNFIMQLRLLNLKGDEIIRVDRNICYAEPYLVTYDKLQNKKMRYYFQEVAALPKDAFWFSHIDLNVEYGLIEKPYKPVIRVGTPVYKEEKKVGVLIMNIFMKKILEQLHSSKLYNTYIVDKDGYFILHPNPQYSFSRYKEPHVKLQDFFKSAQKILTQKEYFSNSLYAAKLELHTPDELTLIIEPTDEFLKSNHKTLYTKFFGMTLVILLLSIPISFFLSKPYAKLKNRVDEANEDLEKRIENKTRELQELNASLEEIIEQRTHEQNILLSLFDLGDAVLFKWRNDEHWSVEYVSKSVEKLLGYTPLEFMEAKITYAECIHPDDLPHVIEEVNEAIEKRLYFFTHDPYRVITKDGKTKWIHDNTVIVRDEEGEVINFVGYLNDITAIKEQELKLQTLSITDSLTQINNRLYIDKVLQKQHYRLLRNDERCSLILLDIDHFKEINDKYGHLVGDKVLKELTKLIRTHLRESDVFGRWGGEEFMIIAPHTSKEEAKIMAEKLRKLIESHTFEDVGSLTVSFGVTECQKEHSLHTAIQTADKALYISKEQGRNKVTAL